MSTAADVYQAAYNNTGDIRQAAAAAAGYAINSGGSLYDQVFYGALANTGNVTVAQDTANNYVASMASQGGTYSMPSTVSGKGLLSSPVVWAGVALVVFALMPRRR